MIKARWGQVIGVINTIFDLLVIAFTLALLANEFRYIGLYINLNYFLATIIMFGFMSILLRAVSMTKL